MKPHSRKDTSLSTSSYSETRLLVTRSLMQTSKKDMHANALSARQSIERDPRNLKTSRIITDSATPAVSINLMLGTMKVDHSKRNNTTRNSTTQQQSSPAKPLTSRNRNPRTSTVGVARSSLTIQFVQPKERNASKSGSKIKRSNSKKEERTVQSTCVSPQKIDVEPAETNKIPVFPLKCNELSGKSLAKSASENKLLTASALSQKPGSFFDSLKEEKSKMSVSSTNTTAKKKQSVQKILRKNLVSVSQSAKKDSSSSSSQVKLKNKANKTHRVQVSTLDTASQIGSMKDIPSVEDSPLLQPTMPSENQLEAKTPSALRPTRSLTSLKADQKRGKTPTLPQQPSTTPQTSTRKIMSSRSRTNIEQNKGYSNVINTPSMSTDRMSPKIVFPAAQTEPKANKVDPLSLKTTYFRPIEDTKLTEYIQSIRNSQKQICKFEYKSTDCLLQEEPQKEAIISSFSTTLQSLPEQAIQTERNILINRDINVEKRAETLPEQLLAQRFESSGSAYRSNMKESPTGSAQKSRLGNQKSEPSFNYMVQTARERTTKKKDNEQYRDRKHDRFYEIPRENLIKSARYNNSDENAMFSNESLTIRGLQRSVVTRGPGDKLSPTSTFMKNGAGGGSEREINNFSKLDQLLKNFKDEKLEKNRAEREKKDQALEDGLFAPSIGGADEEPSAMLSNLRKSLAKILIVKNE